MAKSYLNVEKALEATILSKDITYYEIWHSEAFGSGIDNQEKNYYADFYKLTDSGIEIQSHFFGAFSSIDEVHKQVKNLMSTQMLKEIEPDELQEIVQLRELQKKTEAEQKRAEELKNTLPLGLDESVIYEKLNEIETDYTYGAIDKEEYEHRRKIIQIQAQPISGQFKENAMIKFLKAEQRRKEIEGRLAEQERLVRSSDEGPFTEALIDGGYKIKSQAGFGDWFTKTLPSDARAAAEWLIENGYEEKREVKSAFYSRETSCMADNPSDAEKADNAKIVRVAEKYGFKSNIETASKIPDEIKNYTTAGKTAGGIKMQNSFILGRVASDFKVENAGDKKVGKFSVVYDSGKKDESGKDKGCFVNVECWSESYQEILQKNLVKGDNVLVSGQLSIEDFTQNGHTNKSVKLVNPDVKFLGKGKSTIAQVYVSGRLTHDVELKKAGDKTVAELSLAENYGDGKTNYYTVECWNKQAESMGKNLAKGSLVSVSGELSVEAFERSDKSKGTKVKILNPSVKFLDKFGERVNDGAAAYKGSDKGGM